jgi:hypothetical protein
MNLKKYIRKKLFQLLFGNEIEIGENTVKIDGSSITLPGLTANPTLAAGKMWFRSDTGTILYTPDGTNTRNIAPADWNTMVNKPSTFPPSSHTHDAAEIATGRLSISRLPSGDAGKILVGQGAGNDPAYVDPNVTVVNAQPILKGSIFNTAISANTNIFSSDLSPTNSPTTFRIYACFNASGVLTVKRTKASTTVSEQLNGGTALNANASYIFDIIVETGETINLQYSVAATAVVLKVVEVPGVIS